MPGFAMPPRPEGRGPLPRATAQTAWRHEQAAHAFCQAALLAFGSAAPWPALARASQTRLQQLAPWAGVQGVAPQPAAWPAPASLQAAGWRACIERALNASVSSAMLYQNLLLGEASPSLRRLYQDWQAELLTRRVPELQRAWQAAADRERYHAMQGIDPRQAHTSHGLIGDTIEQLLALLTRQGGLLGMTGTVLRAVHPALLAGAFTGSAAVQGLRHARTPANHHPDSHIDQES